MPLSSSQYPEVELPSPVITQQQVTSSAYQITDVNDNPVQKTVVARVTVGPGAINFFTVWSGESYDQIGQWTDSDLVAAETPLVVAAYPPVTP